jgi:hypothetical protein
MVFCDAERDTCRIVPRAPAAPQTRSRSIMTSSARALALSGTTLVAPAGGAGLLVLDVAGPPRASSACSADTDATPSSSSVRRGRSSIRAATRCW